MVRPGFKQTEVGEIPEDWRISTIGSSTIWMSGGTPDRSNSEFWNGSIPWISGSTLKDSEIFTSDQFLTSDAVAIGSKMAPLNSTLLLVRGSALHNEIRAGLVVAPVSFNQDVKALVPDKTVYPKYLTFYILGMTNALLKLVSSAGNSAGVLDTELVQNFSFIKPSLEEQKAIAKALSDVDKLIVSLEKLIAKKRDIKTATMQQLLTGKTRLPGFGEGKGTKQTELGETPEDWEVIRLGDISDIKTGSKNNQDKFEDGIYPFYVRSQNVERINTYSYDCEAILVPGEGNIGDIFHFIHGKFDAHQRVYVIRSFSEKCNPKYIYYFMKCFFGKHAMENSVKATVDSLRLPTFIEFKMTLPKDIDEQNAISEVLSNTDEEVELLEKRLIKTKSIKQGMMQELLSGRTRLVDPSHQVEQERLHGT